MSKDGKTYAVKLDFFGTQGVYHLLMNTEVKGRSDSRNHSNCLKAVKSHCMNMKGDLDGEFVGGDLSLTEDRFKYLKEAAKKKLETGVPGSFGEAYCSLMDSLDTAQDAADKDDVGTKA